MTQRSQPGWAGFLARLNALGQDVALIKRTLFGSTAIPTAQRSAVSHARTLIGTLTGTVPIDVVAPGATLDIVPITWDKAVSDWPLAVAGSLVSLPSDGLWQIDWSMTFIYPISRLPRAGIGLVPIQVLPGCNFAGGSSGFGATDGTNTALARGTLLGYGSNLQLGTAHQYAVQSPPTIQAPSSINVSADVHRLIEG